VASVAAGQLQRGLVGLGAGVAEEDLSAATEEAVERAGHVLAGLGAEQVGHVQERPGLLRQRVGHRRMGVAQRRDGQAGEEVEVAPAVGVPQLAPLPTHELHGGRAIGGHEWAARQRRVGVHGGGVVGGGHGCALRAHE
jgi:hypothetical protein